MKSLLCWFYFQGIYFFDLHKTLKKLKYKEIREDNLVDNTFKIQKLKYEEIGEDNLVDDTFNIRYNLMQPSLTSILL